MQDSGHCWNDCISSNEAPWRPFVGKIWGLPKIKGTLSGPYYRSLGSILGSPYFGKLPYHPNSGTVQLPFLAPTWPGGQHAQRCCSLTASGEMEGLGVEGLGFGVQILEGRSSMTQQS